MAGYIGSKASVTQVDGYNRTEADAEFVNDPAGVITVSSGNVGIGTSSPATKLDVNGSAYIRAGNILGLYNTDNTNQYQIYNGGSSGTNIGQLVFTQGGVAERMRIDSAGRVTLPYQPFFKARSQSSVNITTQGQTLPFDIVDKNIGSYYNSSTSTFTAPVSGSYVFNVMLFNTPNTIAWSYFNINGTNQSSIEQNTVSAVYNNRSDTFVVYLTSGDYVKLVHWSGTTHLNGTYAGPHSYFSGYLLG